MAADKKQRHLKPQMQNSKVRLTAADHTFNVIVNVFMVLILIVILIPVWSTITLSFRPNDYLGSNLQGMFMPPWEWSPDAYTALLGNDGFLDAFINSFKILIGGVFCALVLTIPMAYVLSVQSLPGRKIINMIVIIPYVFNVGMIPTYLLVRDVGLMNHLPAVFLPGAISTYNCIIMRQFFVGIPNELKESARIDGCTELQVLFRIMIPLSVPGIVSGVTMVFVPSLTTFAVSTMLGGGKVNLIGNIIEQEFTTSSNWNLGSGLSLVMMIFIVLSMALLSRLDKNGEASLI